MMLLLGAAFLIMIGNGRDGAATQWIAAVGAGLIALLPPATREINLALDRVRNPPARTMMWATPLIGLGAAGYFVATAMLQQRDLFPKTHDDCSYLLGMQMLARGRLWMPPHPLADFFDSFYILTRPVYCSIYFPGTALMFVPAIWFHWPTWVLPALASGAAAALLYRIVAELIDGAAAALAVLLLISLTWFRTYSVLLMSQAPMLLLGLLMFWSWLRWRRQRQRRRGWAWLLALGIFAGWGAITRPVDALCFAMPITLGIAMDLKNQNGRAWTTAAAMFIAGAAPFLALQLVFNRGVTGQALQTPYTFYLNQDQPGSAFGFHRVNANQRPASPLPQKQAYYDWCKTYLARHQPDNFLSPWLRAQRLPDGSQRPSYLSMILDTTMPARVLLPLAIAGMLGVRDRRQWAIGATLPLFVFLYVFNPFFLEHYAIVVIPAVILCTLLAINVFADAWPRFARQITASIVMAVVATALAAHVSEIKSWTSGGQIIADETFPSPILRAINEQFPAAADFQKPAVILFRYHRGANFFEEPVYNFESAWPDDEMIIRAHDLGGAARDRQIVEYYAARQPRRTFYLFDPKANDPMQRLGNTGDPQAIMRALAQSERAGT